MITKIFVNTEKYVTKNESKNKMEEEKFPLKMKYKSVGIITNYLNYVISNKFF